MNIVEAWIRLAFLLPPPVLGLFLIAALVVLSRVTGFGGVLGRRRARRRTYARRTRRLV